MSLSLRISLIIGFIAILIASVVASLNYRLQLSQANAQGANLVMQMAENAQGTSEIAAYLIDRELAQEIVEGLHNNDLIAGAQIIGEGKILASAGELNDTLASISVALSNPFNDALAIGKLIVIPDTVFIQSQASASGFQTTITLIGLSAIIAMLVGIYVNLKLTKPLRFLSREVERIDTQQPEKMNDVDIDYAKRDEIGLLVNKTNKLIGALKMRFHSEKALRKSTEELQQRFRLLFEQATAGIALISQEGEITLANPAFNALFDESGAHRAFQSYFVDAASVENELKRLILTPSIEQSELDVVSIKNGKKRYLHCLLSSILDSREVARGDSDSLIEVIVYDITKRREKELKARYEADHDSLTGLMNRRSGKEMLQEQLNKTSNQGETCFALMMIDLDKFKPVNDTYGHDAGDIVLQTISRRVKALLDDNAASFIRWGGDEFLLGITAIDEANIEEFANQLLLQIGKSISINSELAVSVGASIGIMLTQNDILEIDDLIKQADELMYDIKASGRNTFKIKKAR